MVQSTREFTQSKFAIVVGLKLGNEGSHALDHAIRVAGRIPFAALHLLHVCEGDLSERESLALTQRLELYANEKAAALRGPLPRTIGIHLRVGSPSALIVILAREVNADLIVLGASKEGVSSWFLAPTAEKVIAEAPCPVLVAGPQPQPISTVPLIEPPCAECLSTRRISGGGQWWCDRHLARAHAAHTFSYQREMPFATRDSMLGPTGA